MPRQTYTVDFPDGHSQTFEGPTGMSDADLVQRAKQERGFSSGEIPTTWLGGATRHLLEQEPQAVNALLSGASLAAGGIGAAPPVQAAIPAATRALKHLSQFLATGKAGGTPASGADPRSMMFPTADAPGVGDLAQDAIEGGVMGYGGQGVAAGARKVGLTKERLVQGVAGLPPMARGAVRFLSALSMKPLMVDAATSKPVLRAAEQLGEGLTPGGIRKSFSSVIKGMTPGVEAEAAPVVRGARETADQWRAVRAARAAEASPVAAPRPAATSTSQVPGAPPVDADLTPTWLRTMGREADAARPGDAALEATGWPGTPLEAPPLTSVYGSPMAREAVPAKYPEYPSWLRRMGSEADAAQPGDAVLDATGWPGGSVPKGTSGPEYPSWLRRPGVEPMPEPAAGEAVLEATGWPGGSVPRPVQSAGELPSYDTWFRNMGARVERAPGASPAPSAAAPSAAPLVAPPLVAPSAKVSKQQAARAAQFADFTPDARAARAASRASSAGAASDEQSAALDALLQSPAFQALQRATRK